MSQELENLEWVEKTMKLADIKEYEHNAREYSLSDLDTMKDSIIKNGVIEPLVVNTTGVLINGHLRLNALLELGKKQILVTIPSRELTGDEHSELYLRLNRNIAGVNDYSILRKHFTIDELRDGGFSEIEIEDITIDPEDIVVDEKPDVFAYDLVFDSAEQKELANELMQRLSDTHTAEESFENNLISFIKSKRTDG